MEMKEEIEKNPKFLVDKDHKFTEYHEEDDPFFRDVNENPPEILLNLEE